jgi:hypothetical protein
MFRKIADHQVIIHGCIRRLIKDTFDPENAVPVSHYGVQFSAISMKMLFEKGIVSKIRGGISVQDGYDATILSQHDGFTDLSRILLRDLVDEDGRKFAGAPSGGEPLADPGAEGDAAPFLPGEKCAKGDEIFIVGDPPTHRQTTFPYLARFQAESWYLL